MRPVSILRLFLRSVVATPSESKLRFGAIYSLNNLVQSIRFQPCFFCTQLLFIFNFDAVVMRPVSNLR